MTTTQDNTKAKTAKPAKAAKPAKPAKPAKAAAAQKPKEYDIERLKALADEIKDWGDADMTNLIHRLETEEGMDISPKTGGNYVTTLAGLKAESTAGPYMALRNWGNAARRLIAQAG